VRVVRGSPSHCAYVALAGGGRAWWVPEVNGRRLRRGLLAPSGIRPEDWDRIFTPFQRLGDRDNTTGVGLGLALSRGLVEAMGGTLTPEETPGGGMTMVVSLPAAGTAGNVVPDAMADGGTSHDALDAALDAASRHGDGAAATGPSGSAGRATSAGRGGSADPAASAGPAATESPTATTPTGAEEPAR
ncbi:sensor histidine kinase, partial [Catenulispora pinisilvae]|uniref:sensor histidine kinase n=1 Tax=Catenulispora pinisilvae TaxID=2705253 RepID=UPI002B27A8B1